MPKIVGVGHPTHSLSRKNLDGLVNIGPDENSSINRDLSSFQQALRKPIPMNQTPITSTAGDNSLPRSQTKIGSIEDSDPLLSAIKQRHSVEMNRAKRN